jgi:ubiquinone/menaquinone biosynthesis C-methylase UbiE
MIRPALPFPSEKRGDPHGWSTLHFPSSRLVPGPGPDFMSPDPIRPGPLRQSNSSGPDPSEAGNAAGDPGSSSTSGSNLVVPDPGGPVSRASRVPSMLDLVRLSRRPLFPPGGKELYRQIALLTEMDPGDEVLVAGCGPGLTLEYFVREYEVQGSGVDEDPGLVERAEALSRSGGFHSRMQVQHGSLGSLPYRDGVFDIVLGELGLTAATDPETAIRELIRVAKPGGRVALVQLVWKAPVDPERKEVLSRHLGARPLMLVELKRLLRTHGVTRLHTEGWSDEQTAFRPTVTKPFPDFAELFSLPEKVGILWRAWRRWGWRGVRTAIKREQEVHRLLTRERVLGLDLLMGRKVEEAVVGETAAEVEGLADVDGPGAQARAQGDDEGDPPGADPQTRDLPLFTPGDER